jgi:FkbM family methyltransferase
VYLVNKNYYQKIPKDSFFFNEESIARDLFRLKSEGYEIPIINWCIQNFGDKDKIFLDIGAHVGSYSWKLAPHFKHVHSFEPNREVYNCLCANNFLKGLSHKITTHCNGISNDNAIKTYHVRCEDGGGNGFAETELDDDTKIGKTIKTHELEVKTLDSYKFKNVGFIKIDVEGHEADVINGAILTIQENNFPPIIFESWEPGMHHNLSYEYTKKLRKNLFSTFENIGYKIVKISGWSEIFLAVKNEDSKDEIIKGFNKEPLDVWINSIGGVRTNYITNCFESSGLKVKNPIWHKVACHYIKPIKTSAKKNVFCFADDIGISLTSQLNTGTINIKNFKNFYGKEWSISNWLDILEQQIHDWSTEKEIPIYLINTDYLLANKNIIMDEFGVEIKNHKSRKTKKYHKDILPYKEKIKKINKYIQSLPTFRKPIYN